MDKTASNNSIPVSPQLPNLTPTDVNDLIYKHLSDPHNISAIFNIMLTYMSIGMSSKTQIRLLNERVEYLERWRDVAIDVLKRHNLKGEFNEECSKVFEND